VDAQAYPPYQSDTVGWGKTRATRAPHLNTPIPHNGQTSKIQLQHAHFAQTEEVHSQHSKPDPTLDAEQRADWYFCWV